MGGIPLPGILWMILLGLVLLGGCSPVEPGAAVTPTRALPDATKTPAEILTPPAATQTPEPQQTATAPPATPETVIRLGQADRVTLAVDDLFTVEAPAGEWRLAYDPALVRLLTPASPQASSWQFQALAEGLGPITASSETPPCVGEFCPPAQVIQFTVMLEILPP